MFDINEFRDFIKQNITNDNFRKDSVSKEVLLDALCQFEVPIHMYLNKKQQNASMLLNKRFEDNLINKPKSVYVNTWFLYEFGYQRCRQCKGTKTLNNFSKDKNRWNKLQRGCKECAKKYSKTYVQEHKEQLKEYAKKHYQENKEKYRIKEAKRRALTYNAITSDYSQIDDENTQWLRGFLQNELNIKLHTDHIESFINGGKHDKYNWQILTAEDNLRKGDRDSTFVTPIVSNKELIMFLDRV